VTRWFAPGLINVAAGCLLGAGCGGHSTVPPTPASIVGNGDGQHGISGSALPVPIVAEVRDGRDRVLEGTAVRFTIVSGGGATTDTTVVTDAGGHASTTWILGPDPEAAQTVSASIGALTTTFSATADPPGPGATYFGRGEYIEYSAGELPIIITAPHGGILEPAEIPDRTYGETVRDVATEELAREIAAALEALAGARPHLIINRLRRTKLDANREIVEAAQGSRQAQRAWYEFHSFADAAKHAAVTAHGRGFYIDLHGHGHAVQRLELGYLLTGAELRLSDAMLDDPVYENRSSVRTLSEQSAATFVEVLRGPASLGSLLAAGGIPAVPSESQPAPAVGDPYFSGGYNTERHGSSGGGEISGVQIEAHFSGIRDTPANRRAFASALASVLESYLAAHAAIDITATVGR
jgi:hypothetical protein